MVRALVKALVWAICCLAIAALLDVSLTWQVIALAASMSSVSNVVELIDQDMQR